MFGMAAAMKQAEANRKQKEEEKRRKKTRNVTGMQHIAVPVT